MKHGKSFFGPDDLRVSTRAVWLSITGFWSFYWLVVTIRSQLSGVDQLIYLPPRTAVVVFNMLLCLPLYGALRRTLKSTQLVRLFTAALLSTAAAGAYATFDHYVFIAWEDRYVNVAPSGGGKDALSVGKSISEEQMTLGEDLADMGVNGWFFFVAWSVLYLQLETAAEVGALERRAAALRGAAQTAELRALRYQINPHFLFNALNALTALVLARRIDDAGRMISRLAAFFRASLTADPTRDVSLADEFALQRLYLEIEEARFPDRLRVEIDLPENLQGVRVPALITQPLVENAIRHGVANTKAQSLVRISASSAPGGVTITIATDVPASTTKGSVSGFGIGLRNVAERLSARFGEAASLSTTVADARFTATLRLPGLRQ